MPKVFTFGVLLDIVMDEEKVHEIYEVSRSSMGMDISPVDLINIERFTDRVVSLGDYRKELQDYLKQRMHSCAPNLAALIGEQVQNQIKLRSQK